MQLIAILFAEAIDILLGEIEALKIQILEIVIEEASAQFLIERQPREVAVLKHDRHLPADLIEIRLLRLRNARDCSQSEDRSRFSEPRYCHEKSVGTRLETL